jgi:hypothetical protein
MKSGPIRTQEGDCETPEELLTAMNKWIGLGYIVLVKWTCPQCGDRVESGEPNVFHSGGYYHDTPGCGALYTGTRFGFAAIQADPAQRPLVRSLVEKVYSEQPGFEGPLPGLRE